MYKVTIDRVLPPEEGSKYGTDVEIYKQTVECLDIEAVVSVVNGLSESPTKS